MTVILTWPAGWPILPILVFASRFPNCGHPAEAPARPSIITADSLQHYWHQLRERCVYHSAPDNRQTSVTRLGKSCRRSAQNLTSCQNAALATGRRKQRLTRGTQHLSRVHLPHDSSDRASVLHHGHSWHPYLLQS